MSEAELPYRIEYAKTGRAGCKKCKEKIDKGIVRIAAMVQVITNKSQYIKNMTPEISR